MQADSSPAWNGFAVTPSDVTIFQACRALYIGAAGDVAVVMKGGATLTFTDVPVGSILPVRVKQVLSTGTTATDIVALT